VRAGRADRGDAERDAGIVRESNARIAALESEVAHLRQRESFAANNVALDRIASLEADVARLRDYALADAYCPCCATSEGEHAEECDHETDRMRAARAALKGRG